MIISITGWRPAKSDTPWRESVWIGYPGEVPEETAIRFGVEERLMYAVRLPDPEHPDTLQHFDLLEAAMACQLAALHSTSPDYAQEMQQRAERLKLLQRQT